MLRNHDVLVIASIARESFSIAAREALVAGLPVITSDCLGPEEVVHDGENGLVVTTGSAGELAAAMASLLDEPGRLDELRGGAAEAPVTVRSPSRHVDDLIELYGATAPTTPRRQWNVAFVVGADGAIARYRVHHPSESLRLHGATTRVVHYLDPTLERVADGMDAVVLQRVPATAHVLHLVEHWRSAGLLVVFDVDDLIVDPTMVDRIPGPDALPAADRERYVDGLHRYRTTLEHCDGAIVPTTPLAESIGRTTGLPVAVVPNGLGLVELRLAVAATSTLRTDRSSTTLAYFSGSDSHQADLDLISGPLADLMRERPEVELLLVGPITPGPALAPLADRITHRDFQPWTLLYEQLAAVDVNLAPLVLPSEFNEAKSAIKWLEAAAVGVPTVASATRPFLDAIDDDRTGVLCADLDDWSASLTALVDDPLRRRRLGRAARRRAELAHGPHVTAFAYTAALDQLAERRVADRVSAWVDRAPDERAPSAPPLDPYRLAGDGRRVRRRWWPRRRR